VLKLHMKLYVYDGTSSYQHFREVIEPI